MKKLLIIGVLAIFIFSGFAFINRTKSEPKGKYCHVYGKIKIVEYGEDYKVKGVSYGEDLKVKRVNYGEGKVGKWKIVKYGEDFKIKYVDYGQHFKVKFVDYGEGCN